ncbi:hypothetical protein FOZ62_009624 [Perkinsus olseni]|uniref:Uncharacterized protein n=1 Tax=Perkinsus olseni TaxID=32597 RepID=A0A7J6RE29_PEROL|nr:hypothetical protein FOZ62_009624 [Perkinsus olseni]
MAIGAETSSDQFHRHIRHPDDPFYLLVYGKDLEVPGESVPDCDWKGDTLLSSLATLGDHEKLSKLLDEAPEDLGDVNRLNRFGQSPLFLAARWGHHQAAQVSLLATTELGFQTFETEIRVETFDAVQRERHNFPTMLL